MSQARPEPRDATDATRAAQAAALEELPPEDGQDLADARRGFVATLPRVEIRNAEGRVVWSLEDHAFLAEEAPPPTVHPGLWRQARLNMAHGLFQVTGRIWQVRGLDISNMTLIEGDRGVIVVDPLVSTEVAAAALALYRTHRGPRPVTAVIYSHSHVDHYGGVRGVVDEAQVRAGVPIIAPDRFLEEVVSENVLAGTPMVRRAQFQFGATLPRGPRGQVDAGLGKAISRGTVTLIPPTHVIRAPLETHRLDGVEIVFQLTPGTEAPAEMHMFHPAEAALNLAENATHTLHNVLPLRGAQVRDASAWAKYLDRARERFGRQADVVFAQHHWPVWGRERVLEFMARQRDVYRFLHDQTVRLMNRGLRPAEIAERLRLPESLARTWHVRGYYGTVSHNAKAIYQRYLGWYDANPANLAALPPAERARRTVLYMGGADQVVARARRDFARGEYRWVADLMSQVVFADPSHAEARALGADALEQLGYQAESATWRNAYLLGALELRGGRPPAAARAPVSPDLVRAITPELFFDYLAVRVDGERAAGRAFAIRWVFPDLGERHVLRLSNAALSALAGADAEPVDLTVTLERDALTALVLRQLTVEDALASGRLRLEGDPRPLRELFGLLDDFPLMFEVVEPRREAAPGEV